MHHMLITQQIYSMEWLISFAGPKEHGMAYLFIVFYYLHINYPYLKNSEHMKEMHQIVEIVSYLRD